MAQSTILRAKNNTGSTIPAGTVVYISGFDEEDQIPYISTASNDDESKMPAVGIVREDMENGVTDIVKISGPVDSLDTSSVSINANVYVGSNGGITFEEPAAFDEDLLTQQLGTVKKVADYPNGQVQLYPLEIKRRIRHPELIDVEEDQHHFELHAERHRPDAVDQFLHAKQHEIGGGDTINHSLLVGLDDDGHLQYSLVDGTRAFTGVVSGIIPTASSHLTTKGYVDSLIHDEVWREPVIDKDLNSPPAFPNDEDRYIVGTSGSGDWAGESNNLAVYNVSSWDFITPTEGYAIWVKDEDAIYAYTGSAWAQISGASVTGSGASGYVTYWTGTTSVSGESNLFWDDASHQLGIGTVSTNELLTVEGAISLDEITVPSLTAGYGKIYVKSSDSLLYFLNGSGIEYNLTSVGIPETTFQENKTFWNEAIHHLTEAADGYGGGGEVTAAQGADGYVAFFTGDDAIAGDNDLFYNRETGVFSAGRIILPQINDATIPTLAFGDGDTGFYESANDTLHLAFGGAHSWTISSGGFYAASYGGVGIMNEVPSSTNPVYSFAGDANTGMSWAGNDMLSLITGAFEGLRITGTAGGASATVDAYGSIQLHNPNLVLNASSTDDAFIRTGGGDIVFLNSPVLGTIQFEEDTGPAVLADMPVSATPTAGDEMSYALAVDSTSIVTVYAEADSSGGVQNPSLKLNAALTGSVDAITSASEGVAASIDTVVTKITTDGDVDLNEVTLAAGAEGQIKVFSVVVVGNAGDSLKITPAAMIGGTQITFAASPLGLGCTMAYDTGVPGWVVVGNNGGTIA